MGERDEDEQAEKGKSKELFGAMSYSEGELRLLRTVSEPSGELQLQAQTALPGIPGLPFHSHDPPSLESDHSHNSSCRGLLKGLHELVQVDYLEFSLAQSEFWALLLFPRLY